MSVVLTRTNGNILAHHGVKGMKWGVRRDARVLTNRRRNQEVRSVKEKYRVGKIDKTQKRDLIRKANEKKKVDYAELKNKINNPKSQKSFDKLKVDIAKQTIKEVPHDTLKKGLTTVNKLLGGLHVGSLAVETAAASALMPTLAPVFVASLAGSALVETGIHALAQMGIDRLT